jgi:two-component system phosphate regulon sensor histidine kinase PhoR
MIKRGKLFWRLLSSYLLITLGALGAAGWHAHRSLEGFLVEQLAGDLSERARLLELQVAPHLAPLDAAAVDAACKLAGKAADTRFTVIAADGTVLGDSHETPRHMENHAGRPEVAAAFSTGAGQAARFSRTLQRQTLYAAVPARGGPPAPAVIRAGIPTARIERQLASVRRELLVVGFALAVLALVVTLVISRQFSRRVEELKQGAARFAAGELGHRLPVPETRELAELAESLNRMAAELESRMLMVTSQRNQLEAVLSSMQEGVIAVSREERILSMNPAAARWLEIDAARTTGKSVPEAVRHRAAQKFIARSLESLVPLEEDVTVYHGGERVLNIKSAPLCAVGPEPIGVLIVFTDVTPLRRLENMRRDFVANVSHEIRTPLTAIRGFVETLQQGGVEEPAEAARFLGIIAKHVNRLSTIIEDLLMLSRIENESEGGALKRESARLQEILQNAVQICRPKADEKRIAIELAVEEGLAAMLDPLLLEQAVVNLLDNAIKYSEPERSVSITARTQGREIQIEVEDHGIGIEKKHLPRIFERFYRVDPARSRVLGGTGLGLAIVKHIAQAHGGRVTVESALGEGSRFTIHLPHRLPPD